MISKQKPMATRVKEARPKKLTHKQAEIIVKNAAVKMEQLRCNNAKE